MQQKGRGSDDIDVRFFSLRCQISGKQSHLGVGGEPQSSFQKRLAHLLINFQRIPKNLGIILSTRILVTLYFREHALIQIVHRRLAQILCYPLLPPTRIPSLRTLTNPPTSTLIRIKG